ncbi:iron complex transport system substrate-binding protein [Cohnella sp. SGD-V74]|uniref:AraC family transcriptional regulator n=1 Tax=unclassified Cohnella TaxID=2636738 RepID=UPI000D4FF5A5|nr:MULTISPECIES: AraC family transcriptional regulator [unclassified Cohnella]PRX65784.1 iron complex transport system substrate-binding protein [Cohnella sp. SGD-V74]
MLLRLNEHIRLWNLVHIRHIEVRKMTLKPGGRSSFSFRSGSFLCMSRGNALIILNRRTYSANNIHIIHAPGKSYCEVNAGIDGAEFIIAGYEADLETPLPEDLLPLLDKCNPFEAVYSVIPHQPVALYDLLAEMLRLSLLPDLPEQPASLQLKGVFYQWLSHALEQYHCGPAPSKATSPAELVTMTLEYMLKHYSEPHTLDTLALAVNRSPGHLSNCFKQVLNRGPIDCLIRLRIHKACELLAETKLPLRTIASAIGYQDAYYFSNAFKKHKGMSPQRYRKLLQQEDVTLSEGRNPIVDPQQPCYIANRDNENHCQHESGGSANMFKNSMMVPASLLLAFGLLIGGCGSNAANDATPSASPGASPSQASSGATDSGDSAREPSTRLVATPMGEVEVPTEPQRVVTDFYLGYLLALGVKPAGTNRMFLENPYLEDQVAGIADISDNLEAIVGLNPDLIVTGDADKYEAYSKIAPTVYLENNSNVREQVKQLSEVLGKQEDASSWLTTFEDKLAAAKERVKTHLKDGETVTVFDGGIIKEVTLYGSAYTGKTIHGELGMPMNENVVKDIDPKVGWLRISSEVVDKYAGEHIFMAVNAKNETFDYAGDSIWGTLPAVKSNQLYEIDGYRFYFSDPISVMGQIEDIADMMDERATANAAQ